MTFWKKENMCFKEKGDVSMALIIVLWVISGSMFAKSLWNFRSERGEQHIKGDRILMYVSVIFVLITGVITILERGI